jgi:hypothetical protein
VSIHRNIDKHPLIKCSVQDLAAIYEASNPEWRDSGIYPLFSPLLDFFKDGMVVYFVLHAVIH